MVGRIINALTATPSIILYYLIKCALSRPYSSVGSERMAVNHEVAGSNPAGADVIITDIITVII